MADKLTPRQKVFVSEYLKDMNAARAYVRAGYSPHTARFSASRLLTNDNVREAVKNGMRERQKAVKIDTEWVLRTLVEMFEADIGDIFREDGSIKHISEWPPIWRKKLISMDVNQVANGNEVIGQNKKVRFIDPMRVLENIGKHIDVGAFQDKLKVDMSDMGARIKEARKVFDESSCQDVKRTR